MGSSGTTLRSAVGSSSLRVGLGIAPCRDPNTHGQTRGGSFKTITTLNRPYRLARLTTQRSARRCPPFRPGSCLASAYSVPFVPNAQVPAKQARRLFYRSHTWSRRISRTAWRRRSHFAPFIHSFRRRSFIYWACTIPLRTISVSKRVQLRSLGLKVSIHHGFD